MRLLIILFTIFLVVYTNASDKGSKYENSDLAVNIAESNPRFRRGYHIHYYTYCNDQSIRYCNQKANKDNKCVYWEDNLGRSKYICTCDNCFHGDHCEYVKKESRHCRLKYKRSLDQHDAD